MSSRLLNTDQQPAAVAPAATAPRMLTDPRPTAFDFDDVFSDGDDDDRLPAFSPDLVRQVMAKHREAEAEWVDAESVDLAPSDGRSESQDSDCQSSIDLDGPPLNAGSLSASNSSLRESGHNGVLSRPDHASSATWDGLPSPYPAVVIDISQLPSSRVEVTQEQHRSVELSSAPDSPDRQDDIPSPPHSAPMSGSPSMTQVPSVSPSTTSSSPSTPIPAQQHRPTRSVGPTTFQKVVSKTRPTFLPPKSRKEDEKHMADWESMMKQSRTAGELTPTHLEVQLGL